MKTAATFALAWIVLTAISGFVGFAAAAWFGGGFIVAAIIAFWEAGADHARREAATQSDRNAGES